MELLRTRKEKPEEMEASDVILMPSVHLRKILNQMNN